VTFAAATGLRPGEWIALEQRDVNRKAGVVYVRRAFRNGRVKAPKTTAEGASYAVKDGNRVSRSLFIDLLQ